MKIVFKSQQYNTILVKAIEKHFYFFLRDSIGGKFNSNMNVAYKCNNSILIKYFYNILQCDTFALHITGGVFDLLDDER